MTLRQALICSGLIFGLTFGSSDAEAAKGLKKKGDSVIHGAVVHVDTSKDLISVLPHHSTKKKSSKTVQNQQVAGVNQANANQAGKPSAVHPKKFLVNSKTRFFSLQGTQQSPAKFTSVHKGEFVTVMYKKETADLVAIHRPKKKSAAKYTSRSNRVSRLTNSSTTPTSSSNYANQSGKTGKSTTTSGTTKGSGTTAATTSKGTVTKGSGGTSTNHGGSVAATNNSKPPVHHTQPVHTTPPPKPPAHKK